jgi:hypothetical protein
MNAGDPCAQPVNHNGYFFIQEPRAVKKAVTFGGKRDTTLPEADFWKSTFKGNQSAV